MLVGSHWATMLEADTNISSSGSSPSGAGTFTYNDGATSLLFCGHTDEIIPIATETQTGAQYFSINLATASPPLSPTTYPLPSSTSPFSNSAASISTSMPTTTSTSDKLSVGAEVGSIVGAIFGVLAVGVAIYYGHKQLKKTGA